ncbi:MAG TPA: HAD family hydrolase [Armatimonadetes bacterium]|nr:HAD family hydrolase [Armatimonadota bacterium]
MRPWTDVRAVLFDFDGTLVDTRIDFARMRQEVRALLPQFGVQLDPRPRYILELIEAAEALLRQQDRQWARAFRQAAEEIVLTLELEGAQRAQVIPGIPDLLRRLRAAGIQIAVLTRNCRVAVELALTRCPLLYDVLLTRDDVSLIKPHPAHAQHALTSLGVPQAQSVLVGDHVGDMECAQKLGLRGVGVLTGSSSHEELMAAGAEVVLPSAAELASLLGLENADLKGSLAKWMSGGDFAGRPGIADQSGL